MSPTLTRFLFWQSPLLETAAVFVLDFSLLVAGGEPQSASASASAEEHVAASFRQARSSPLRCTALCGPALLQWQSRAHVLPLLVCSVILIPSVEKWWQKGVPHCFLAPSHGRFPTPAWPTLRATLLACLRDLPSATFSADDATGARWLLTKSGTAQFRSFCSVPNCRDGHLRAAVEFRGSIASMTTPLSLSFLNVTIQTFRKSRLDPALFSFFSASCVDVSKPSPVSVFGCVG